MQTRILPYTSVFIKLLKGPLDYTEKSAWEKLLQYKTELPAFLMTLGLRLVLHEEDGYAFLEQTAGEEEDTQVSWIIRRPLTYEESVMLVLLRDMMADFETSDDSSRELIRKRREIKESAELFFKEMPSRVKFLREMDRLIDKMEEYGFLAMADDHEIADEQRFRVKKIIKARVDSEQLEDFIDQLKTRKEKNRSNEN